MLSLSSCNMLDAPCNAFVADSDTARDFDERLDEALDSLMRLCTGFVVTQIFRANLSSALNASQGVICAEEMETEGAQLKYVGTFPPYSSSSSSGLAGTGAVRHSSCSLNTHLKQPPILILLLLKLCWLRFRFYDPIFLPVSSFNVTFSQTTFLKIVV